MLITESIPNQKISITVDYVKPLPHAMTTVIKDSPKPADRINSSSALFEQVEAHARPVRTAALAGNNAKAANLLRGGEDKQRRSKPRWRKSEVFSACSA